jgi:hypothetical protein
LIHSVVMLRHKLHFGPYRTPLFRYGQRVEDERRGLVRIVGVTAGRISWPIGQQGRSKAIVLFKGLARAVRREAAAAVMHAWSVGPATVNKWRRALGVARWNEGDLRLKAANGKRNKTGIAAMHATARDPVRCAKIAAARRGKPRPPHVVEAMRRARLGREASPATRAKMRAAAKARGAWPPAAGRPLTARELRLIRSLPPAEAAKRTGRTLAAVYSQRSKLGLAG